MPKLEQEKSVMILSLPQDIHRGFKSVCATQGQTMVAVLREFMAAYIAQIQKTEIGANSPSEN